jgi:hypothetical protein
MFHVPKLFHVSLLYLINPSPLFYIFHLLLFHKHLLTVLHPILILLHYILSSSSDFPLNLFKFVSCSMISLFSPIHCPVAPLASLSFCYSFLYTYFSPSNFPRYLCLHFLLWIQWMKNKISNISSSRNRNNQCLYCQSMRLESILSLFHLNSNLIAHFHNANLIN